MQFITKSMERLVGNESLVIKSAARAKEASGQIWERCKCIVPVLSTRMNLSFTEPQFLGTKSWSSISRISVLNAHVESEKRCLLTFGQVQGSMFFRLNTFYGGWQSCTREQSGFEQVRCEAQMNELACLLLDQAPSTSQTFILVLTIRSLILTYIIPFYQKALYSLTSYHQYQPTKPTTLPQFELVYLSVLVEALVTSFPVVIIAFISCLSN